MSMRTIRVRWACSASILLVACWGSHPTAAPPPAAAAGAPTPVLAVPAAVRASEDTITRVRMRNVNFHLPREVVLRIATLQGRMIPKSSSRPITFDDDGSFALRIATGEIALDTVALRRLMNDWVFAYEGAPLRELSFSTEGDHLVQKGILHKVIDIPFRIEATVALDPNGDIRIHPESMKILGVDGKGLMRAFDLTLEKVMDVSGAKGVRVEGNDLVLQPTVILPPPAIEGRIVALHVSDGRLVQTFGGGNADDDAPLTVPDSSSNYMYFRGGTVRFGKLFMVDADMEVVDADPADAFEFNLREYARQLIAGYSRTRADQGLEVLMPDADDAGTPIVVTRSRGG